MATYTHEEFTGNPTLLPDYLPTVDNRFTKVSSTEINVNNGDALITVSSDNIIISVNGTELFNHQINFNGLYIDLVLGANLIYFKITRPDQDYQCHFAWITDGNNNNYVGTYYAYGSTYNYLEIGDLEFVKVSNNATGYSFVKMINFAAPAGNVAYSSIAPLANGGQLALYASDVLSCSTLTRGSTISLPNGKNYLTIGSNTMVEISA